MYPVQVVRWFHTAVGRDGRLVLLYGTLLALCATVVLAGRAARRHGSAAGRRVDLAWAAALSANYAVMLACLLWYGRHHLSAALPLHECHVVALAAPIAQLTRRRLPRAIVYFWGLGLTTQAFVHRNPLCSLSYFGTWVFWTFHEMNLAAAAYDLLVRRYRPTWRDFRLAAGFGLAFAAAVAVLDWYLWADYAMVGPVATYPPIAAFGPWPGRVVWLVLLALATMVLLTMVWPRNWPALRTSVRRDVNPPAVNAQPALLV